MTKPMLFTALIIAALMADKVAANIALAFSPGAF
jgi:hypothetical protein